MSPCCSAILVAGNRVPTGRSTIRVTGKQFTLETITDLPSSWLFCCQIRGFHPLCTARPRSRQHSTCPTVWPPCSWPQVFLPFWCGRVRRLLGRLARPNHGRCWHVSFRRAFLVAVRDECHPVLSSSSSPYSPATIDSSNPSTTTPTAITNG